MTRRWTAAAVTVVVGLSLAGCGSDDASDAQEAADSASELASQLPTDLDDATSGDTDLDGEADAGAALTPEAFCGFLAQEAPQVVDLQPAEYAAATFGSAVFAFYSDQGLLTDIDGADMDALATEGCPDEAADLLSALGAESFADLLSS